MFFTFRLALLTRHGKSASAVVPINDLLQLLRVAEQAVGLVYRPDLLQVYAMLTTTQQTRLLADAEWLVKCLREFADGDRLNFVILSVHQPLMHGFYGESDMHHGTSTWFAPTNRRNT